MFYDDKNTAAFADDTYDFAMSVFGLSGGVVSGTAASAFHIHASADTTENAPVRVSLDAAPFEFLNSGSTLLVGGGDVTAVIVPATPATPFNQGHAAASFLEALNPSDADDDNLRSSSRCSSHARQTHHSLPRRHRRPGRQGRQLRRTA